MDDRIRPMVSLTEPNLRTGLKPVNLMASPRGFEPLLPP